MECVEGFVLPLRIYFNLDYSDLLDDSHLTVLRNSQQNIDLLKYMSYLETRIIFNYFICKKKCYTAQHNEGTHA